MSDASRGPKPPSMARRRSSTGGRERRASGSSSRHASGFGRRGSRHSSRATSSNNRKEKAAIQYLDEQGNDVTPRSLLQPQRRKTLEDVRLERNAFLESLSSVKDVSWGSRMLSSAEGSLASSLPHFSYMAGGSQSTQSDTSERRSSTFEHEDGEESDSTQIAGAEETGREDQELTDAQLNHMVYIKLEETETVWMLDLQPTWVPDDDEEARDAVAAENAEYEALLEKKKTVPDDYNDRFSQTTVFLQKEQEVQTEPRSVANADCQVSVADMHDSYDALAQLQAKVKGRGQFAKLASKVIAQDKGGAIALEDPRKLLQRQSKDLGFGISDEWEEADEGKAGTPEEQWKTAKASRAVKRHLHLLERLIEHDTFAPLQSLVKEEDVFEVAADPSDKTPLRHAWAYACDLTQDMAVTCCAWNRANPDIVAVGYGQSAMPRADAPGLVCCWSVKQPRYPHRVYRTPSTVMSVDFSGEHPQMLAVGMASGTVAIYDVYDEAAQPLLDTTPNDPASKHTHPVWQIQFVSLVGKQGADDREEMLVSGSSDGLVLQWHLHKGLDSSLLVKVKRIASHSKAHHGNSKTAFIARQAGVMAMAFSPVDASLYLVGTEDGNIHKCSTSYSDTYLDSYFEHSSSVYRLQYCPRDNGRFLSCSSDWTLKLWNAEEGTVVQKLQTTNSAVRDACWSHHRANVLASISDEELFLWNLDELEQDPIFTCRPAKGAKLSCVLFNPRREYLVAGDTAGRLHVYTLHLRKRRASDGGCGEEQGAVDHKQQETGEDAKSSSSGSGGDGKETATTAGTDGATPRPGTSTSGSSGHPPGTAGTGVNRTTSAGRRSEAKHSVGERPDTSATAATSASNASHGSTLKPPPTAESGGRSRASGTVKADAGGDAEQPANGVTKGVGQ